MFGMYVKIRVPKSVLTSSETLWLWSRQMIDMLKPYRKFTLKNFIQSDFEPLTEVQIYSNVGKDLQQVESCQCANRLFFLVFQFCLVDKIIGKTKAKCEK